MSLPSRGCVVKYFRFFADGLAVTMNGTRYRYLVYATVPPFVIVWPVGVDAEQTADLAGAAAAVDLYRSLMSVLTQTDANIAPWMPLSAFDTHTPCSKALQQQLHLWTSDFFADEATLYRVSIY